MYPLVIRLTSPTLSASMLFKEHPMFKKGDLVRVKAVVPEGPVVSMRMTEDGVVYYLVEWVDAEGSTQQRWFTEDQLTEA